MRLSPKALAAVAAVLPFSAMAQAPETVSAANPAGLVQALKSAGMSPTLGKDDYGDPMIDFKVAGYETTLVFYGCDEDTNDGCDSLQLKAGFDRKAAWTPAEAMQISKKYRFASVWLDEEGDPWVQWDIVTGKGIPAQVFLDSIEGFGDTLTDAAELIFPDE